jgi:hypothetical protein
MFLLPNVALMIYKNEEDCMFLDLIFVMHGSGPKQHALI